MAYENWREEARAVSDGCTEMSCLYHGHQNLQIFERWQREVDPRHRQS